MNNNTGEEPDSTRSKKYGYNGDGSVGQKRIWNSQFE